MNSSDLKNISIDFYESFSILVTINITTILFSSLSLVFGFIFIVIILSNRSYRTIANVLTVNSSISILLLSISTLSISVYALNRDLNQYRFDIRIEMGNVYLCHIRTYLAHLSFFALIYSYVIQAFYRLFGTIYYHRRLYQQWKIYRYAISFKWMMSFLQLLPIGLGNHQRFLENEFLCQMEINNSQILTYLAFTNYIIPLTIIMIIYFIITHSMKQKQSNGTHRYNIHRTRRQIVLTRRVVILIAILLILGGPYSTLILMERFSIGHPPTYSHRIGFMCISISAALSIMTMSYFTRPTYLIIEKMFIRKMRSNQKKDSYKLTSSRNNLEMTPKMNNENQFNSLFDQSIKNN